MDFNKPKPGAGKFASGNKFKGRASGGDNNTNSERSSRNSNADRPAREDRTNKFSGEGKKVYNRSERFTRPGDAPGKRPPMDSKFPEGKRPAFKGGPKFNKTGPYKGNSRSENPRDNAGGTDAGGERRERSDRPERGERPNRSEEGRPERPRYNDRNTASSYSARPERKFTGGGDKKPYGAKPAGDRSFSKDRPRTSDRTDKPYSDKPRFDKFKDNDNDRSRAPREDAGDTDRPVKKAREYTASLPEGPKRSFDRSKPEARKEYGDKKPSDRTKPAGNREYDSEARRSFRPRNGDNTEAPSYDLKRYQSRERKKEVEKDDDGLIRLNRYIANAGICSRREADALIESGEIKVNGEVVVEMGYQVRPEDTVTYGKKRLNREKMVYVLLNKPKDFITTTEDPEGRKTVMDLVDNASKERIFPVGRLDRNTTGLLLFTNDGELAHKLTHPSNNISKIYQVELDKPITKDHFGQIVEGLDLEDGKAIVDDLALVGGSNTFLGIQIHIGRNRIVRRIFEHLGYDVVALDRVQYAGLTKKDLPRGKWRFLNEKEVIRLKYFL